MREMLAIGSIVKTHGVRGGIRVRSHSGETGHFLALEEVFLGVGTPQKAYRVEEVRVMHDSVFLRLEGIGTPEDARALRGQDVWVHRRFAAPLVSGEYYVGDLCECSVWFGKDELGRVRAVIEAGASDVIEVANEEGAVFLVPFVEEYVGKVDIGKNRIELKRGREEL